MQFVRIFKVSDLRFRIIIASNSKREYDRIASKQATAETRRNTPEYVNKILEMRKRMVRVFSRLLEDYTR